MQLASCTTFACVIYKCKKENLAHILIFTKITGLQSASCTAFVGVIYKCKKENLAHILIFTKITGLKILNLQVLSSESLPATSYEGSFCNFTY